MTISSLAATGLPQTLTVGSGFKFGSSPKGIMAIIAAPVMSSAHGGDHVDIGYDWQETNSSIGPTHFYWLQEVESDNTLPD